MINAMNKSKQSDSPSLGEGGERLSLLELNALVRRSLEQCQIGRASCRERV